MIPHPTGATLARGLTSLLILLGAAEAGAAVVSLGTAETFAILAGSAITNTGNTIINGNVGISPGATAPSGFETVILNGTLEVATSAANQAQADALSAYNSLAALPTTTTLPDAELGGLILGPGVYSLSSAQLTGMLTLNGAGSYVFKIGSTLTTAVASNMSLINGADGADVFFQVASSATIGAGSSLTGSIVAFASQSLEAGASVQGHIIALNGAVTLINNTVTVPEPGAPLLIGLGVTLLLFQRHGRAA